MGSACICCQFLSIHDTIRTTFSSGVVMQVILMIMEYNKDKTKMADE